MDIQMIKTDKLKPYAKNAKKHPAEQIDRIANSLKEFGFRQPIVVDKDNIVIIGHGRLLAAQKLGLKTVPVTFADDLTPQQIKALRLADNKVAESEWDLDLLLDDLSDISELDMSDFGFDFIEDDPAEEEVDDENELPPPCQHNVFENQERKQFPITNYYGIPDLFPTQTKCDKMLRFCDFNDVEDHENYIAHFFYDDFKFMSAWREPDKYLDKLRKFKAVVCPDFSSYTDFPIALQILGAYRRNWCGAYWQSLGIDIIPDVQWGDTEECYNWCFEGIPKNATVALSSLGVSGNAEWNGKDGDWFKRGFDEMMKRLDPSTILWYGDVIKGCECDRIIHIPSFYAQKRELLNSMRDAKNGKK